MERVGINRTRIGLLGIAQRMGAEIELRDEAETHGGEPIATLLARSSELVGVEVGGREVPLAIDELPLIALLGCFARGETIVRDAAELRLKESDRIEAVVEGLRGLGADIEALADGFAVRGNEEGLRGGMLDSRGDHRMAMLGATAGLASREGVEVVGMEAAGVSYPRFETDLAHLTATEGS
jgi:3-phosphoshikimate 1-carboxyvinyltransferase